MIQLTNQEIMSIFGTCEIIERPAFFDISRAIESALKKKIIDSEELLPCGQPDLYADGYMACIEDLKNLLMEEK